MRLDPSDLRPAYRQVADDLRRAITSGAYQPGDRLPSGRVLARQYAIAPMTVASALSVLREEGLVASWQGRGVYVLEPGQRPATTATARDDRRLAALEADIAGLRRQVSTLRDQVARLHGGAGSPDPDAVPEPVGQFPHARDLPEHPDDRARRSR